MTVSNLMMCPIRQCKLDAIHYDDSANKSDREVAQAVVNAVWIEFKADDESTWPKDKYTPNGQKWIYEDTLGRVEMSTWWEGGFISCAAQFIIRYADPQELLYVGEKP